METRIHFFSFFQGKFQDLYNFIQYTAQLWTKNYQELFYLRLDWFRNWANLIDLQQKTIAGFFVNCYLDSVFERKNKSNAFKS